MDICVETNTFMINYFNFLPTDCKALIFKIKCEPYFKILRLVNRYGINKEDIYFIDEHNININDIKNDVIILKNSISKKKLYYGFYNNIFIHVYQLPSIKYMQIGDIITNNNWESYEGKLNHIRKDKYIYLGNIDIYAITENMLSMMFYNENTSKRKDIIENNINILRHIKPFIDNGGNKKNLSDALILAKPIDKIENITDAHDFKIIISWYTAEYYNIIHPKGYLNICNFESIIKNL